MKASVFLQGMEDLGVQFFTGVPDSLLGPLNNELFSRHGDKGRHIVAANEGGAVALAAGHYIATGRPALCYLQNSGLGHAANPIASLLSDQVFGIPCVFVVGWRGEPGVKDEPQHAFQGLITREMLLLLGLTVFPLTQATTQEAFDAMVEKARETLGAGHSVAFLVSQGGLTDGPQTAFENSYRLRREDALREILQGATEKEIFVCTTGKTSREVFSLREELGQSHDHDFLTVGSMGHASMIALAIAQEKPDFTIWCLDGDGAGLMHLGGLVLEAHHHPANLNHVLLNNGAHESVGGMPVSGGTLWFAPLARSLGFDQVFTSESAGELRAQMSRIRASGVQKLRFLEVMLQQGSRADLGRPTQTPKQNLQALMATLQQKERGE